ncbi:MULTISPECIES: GNAT family N-acetyltransferase [unclassified Mesorhizobium]|uniref:GNAT family N-acetyltransferase n=1 Tax=unclassified Mesorhizobium TaxID=325217 RepID=UPI0019255D3B|nr:MULTISPECIES: GNAT family protein [unclassified Mesorhizobium]BCG82808.1 acetyltransferase [Mesorhizobium sp. 113-3-3]BCG90684.1 acetyltransferase [Mesorhizobium sp. 113-3-9]
MNIETERLFMRPIRPWDADALHRLSCDPLVFESSVEGISPTREMSDARLSLYLHEWDTYGYGFWMVYEREDNGDLRFVGQSGLRRFDENDIQTGCFLFGARCGRGIGPESIKPVIEFAFATQSIDRLVSLVRPTNIRSLRTKTALGYSFLGPVVVDGTDYMFFELRRPPV